ncbi:MAG: hypothetical protein KH216_10660 [Clostridiales bacterium]|jgi:hypothetical protein|nr:hypothetical protein [Clostridiales bacterium]
MKHKIAVMLIMIMMATIMFSSFAYAEADNKVGIKIEFDKKAYVKGETAAATLTLTGLSDEKDAGLKLGAFETHLKFDKTKLTYKASVFETDLFSGTESDKLTKEFQPTKDYANVILVAFAYESGISLNSVDTNGNLKIGTVKFTINDKVSDKIEIGFDESEKTYVTELVQPDLSSKFDITVPQEDSTADIKNVIAENASATFANNTVKGSINIRLSKGQGAILIAQLYDTSTGLTKGTVVNPNLTASANINDITFNNISDKTNLTVKYYLWESFANMKALTTIQPIEVQ